MEALLAVRDAGFQLRTWGDGYGYALVATGRIEAMVDPEVALWDVAPMPVILAEAGGRFTDYAGAVDPSSGSRCGDQRLHRTTTSWRCFARGDERGEEADHMVLSDERYFEALADDDSRFAAIPVARSRVGRCPPAPSGTSRR